MENEKKIIIDELDKYKRLYNLTDCEKQEI